MIKNLNNLIIDDRQVINYNKDISMKSAEGYSILVCRCYCTIVANESISYNMTVEDNESFDLNKELIMEQVSLYKQQAEALARENNVPII